MREMTTEQFKKLPKYAQKELALLESQVKNLANQVYELRRPYTPEDTYYYFDYVEGNRVEFPIPLRKYQPIHIKLDSGEVLNIVKDDYNGNLINVRADSTKIRVLPKTSNSLDIGVE